MDAIAQTQTPPREGDAPSRKRNRRDGAPAAAAAAAFHRCATAAPSPSSAPWWREKNRHGVAPAAREAAAAATVSPFTDRLTRSTLCKHNNNNSNNNDNGAFFSSPLFRLEPLREETNANGADNDNFNLSQASFATSVTFGSNVAASGSECSARMDCWSGGSGVGGGSIGDFRSDCGFGGNGNDGYHRAMIGNMVGGAVKSVVGCSIGGRPGFISLGSHLNDSMGSYPPLTKRVRMDYRSEWAMPPQMMSPSMEEDSVAPSPPSALSRKTGPGRIGLRMNVDKPGRRCCHVCSAEDTADPKDVGIAAAGPPKQDLAGAVPNTPRSRSLLTYFQPTRRQAASPHEPPRFRHQRERSPLDAPSSLSQCRYCDKPTCGACARRCEMCQHRFCTFCTKVDYDSGVAERITCFECDEGAINGGHDGDCEMMDL